MTSPVVIVDYNPRWPRLYEEEKKGILSIIRRYVVAIEHVGSTSVPGLGAKPIIDIIVGLRQLADAAGCIEPLKSIGYEYVPQFEASIPERRYFRKPPGEIQSHHLHMVEQSSEFWERHLLFRDFLRRNPDVAQQYYELKKELAGKFRTDLEGYTDAKTSFIKSVVAQARGG